MVPNTDVEEGKSATICAGKEGRKSNESKSSSNKPHDQEINDTTKTKCRANSPFRKKNPKTGSESEELGKNTKTTTDSEKQKEKKENIEKPRETKVETNVGDEKAKKGEEQKMEEAKGTPIQEQKPDAAVVETQNEDSEAQKKAPVAQKTSDTALNSPEGKPVSGKTGKPRSDLNQRRPSVIPKLKSLQRVVSRGTQQKPNMSQSRLPVKTTQKDLEKNRSEKALDGAKRKTNQVKAVMKSFPMKKELRPSAKIKEAMAEEFNYLVPLYEKQFKKISDVWVNTIYCSLIMRTNLVKLLFNAFPSINKNQFYTEDDRLLECIANAKTSTKMEAENLIKVIKNLMASREKTKEDYEIMVANRQIAECYNHDWRRLIKKMAGVGEETKHLQIETPQLQRKKEANEINTNEKIRRMEINLCKKEDEIKKLVNQLNVLKQKGNSCKDTILLKIPDFKEIKADVQSLSTVQKEYEELKAKYVSQNYTFEKKIKDLEELVEEKKKILEKERDVKKQLQLLLTQLQAHQKRLATTIGREQVDFVMGRSLQERHKRREQLWLAAVKLVLRGFLLQMKRLERDRNKMLLQVQSNDFENFTDTVIIIQKDNFIKSIKQQMNDLQKVCMCQNVKSP